MKAEPNIPTQLFITDGKRIEAILQRAVRKALLEHKRAGNSIAVSRNGQVEIIPAHAIQLVDEDGT